MARFRLVIVLLLLAVAIGVGSLVGFVAGKWRPAPSGAWLNTSTVLKQVQTLSQLVTVKYVLEKVIVYEDVKWFGENRVLLLAHGIVKAGVDLSQLKTSDVAIGEKKITIVLPREAITDVYLDDQKTEVIERTTGVLRHFDKDLEQNARRQAVDDIRRAAKLNGILKDARERAQAQLTVLFHQLGFETVEFKNR